MRSQKLTVLLVASTVGATALGMACSQGSNGASDHRDVFGRGVGTSAQANSNQGGLPGNSNFIQTLNNATPQVNTVTQAIAQLLTCTGTETALVADKFNRLNSVVNTGQTLPRFVCFDNVGSTSTGGSTSTAVNTFTAVVSDLPSSSTGSSGSSGPYGGSSTDPVANEIEHQVSLGTTPAGAPTNEYSALGAIGAALCGSQSTNGNAVFAPAANGIDAISTFVTDTGESGSCTVTGNDSCFTCHRDGFIFALADTPYPNNPNESWFNDGVTIDELGLPPSFTGLAEDFIDVVQDFTSVAPILAANDQAVVPGVIAAAVAAGDVRHVVARSTMDTISGGVGYDSSKVDASTTPPSADLPLVVVANPDAFLNGFTLPPRPPSPSGTVVQFVAETSVPDFWLRAGLVTAGILRQATVNALQVLDYKNGPYSPLRQQVLAALPTPLPPGQADALIDAAIQNLIPRPDGTTITTLQINALKAETDSSSSAGAVALAEGAWNDAFLTFFNDTASALTASEVTEFNTNDNATSTADFGSQGEELPF
jgi:hypothetical protein